MKQNCPKCFPPPFFSAGAKAPPPCPGGQEGPRGRGTRSGCGTGRPSTCCGSWSSSPSSPSCPGRLDSDVGCGQSLLCPPTPISTPKNCPLWTAWPRIFSLIWQFSTYACGDAEAEAEILANKILAENVIGRRSGTELRPILGQFTVACPCRIHC